MKLVCIESGSTGNGYALIGEEEILLLEAGVKWQSVVQAIGYKVSSVKGCLITHEHNDHCVYLETYAKYVPIFATSGTLRAKNIEDSFHYNSIKLSKPFKIGRFNILPFKTIHDSAEPCGYLIQHPEVDGNILFATDTASIPLRFNNLAYILIECNYDKALLQKSVMDGNIPQSVAARICKSHMALVNCKRFLQANDLSGTRGIMLIHLSHNNSDENMFVNAIQNLTGKFVCTARKGKIMDLL